MRSQGAIVRTPRVLLVLGVVAAAAFAACGGGTGPTGATTTTSPGATAGLPGTTDTTTATTNPGGGGVIDTCALVTAAELKSATGADYGEGVADGYGQCIYRVGGATANNGEGQIVIAVVDSPVSTLKGMFGAGGIDLTIAGKTAFWNPTAGLQTLWVDLGGRALALSFDPVTDATRAIAQKVAEVAVAGL